MIRCIIAEDEQILRRGLVLTTDWKALGCELIGEAQDGNEALTLIRRLKPDLVITDIRMPALDGLTLIQESISICHPEFIIMSGYNDFAYAKQAIHLGVTDYLCKPIDEEEFQQAVINAGEKIRQKKVQAALTPKVNIINSSNLILFKEYLSDHDTSKNRYISNAISYIEENYQKDIAIGDICKKLLISESYLTKLFRECTGYSFIDYLTYCRMKKACELLKDESIKIYAVAEQVGYRDQRYFSVLFKKIVGLTPKQFRERQHS